MRHVPGVNSRVVRATLILAACALMTACTAGAINTESSVERRPGVSVSPLAAAASRGDRGKIAGHPNSQRGGPAQAQPAAEAFAEYEQTGMASWYGGRFHGRRTANGERFDRTLLTAAHPSLPLPSYVRVTNLANDRSVMVRVNDRGPYAHGRLIDVSERTAALLDFKRRGKAEVRVEYVGRAPKGGDADERLLLASYKGPGDPREEGRIQVAAADLAGRSQGVVSPVPPIVLASAAAGRMVAFADEPAPAGERGARDAVEVLTNGYGADERIFMAFETASTSAEE